MRRRTYFVVAVVAFGVLAGTLLAQGTSGTILGRVYDQSGALLPGVTVTATDKNTGQKRTAVTDDQGRYTMVQLRIGDYQVEAELPGFQASIQNVTLTLEGDSVVNFTLRVGGAETEVVVTSEAPLVDTTGSAIRNLVTDRQIRDLPLNGRSFTDLATLQSGVIVDYFASRTQIGLEGAKISIAGTRSRQSLFQLDGTDLRNPKGATPGSLAGVQLGVDTIQEFSVITTVANAEYGAFTGGVVNAITKSGTNDLTGTLFEFHRNSALDARNFFDRDPANPAHRSDPPPFKRNQYGFTLGGPIKKNKLFFLTSFEGLNERLTTTNTAFVPSLDARRGLIPREGQFTVSPVTRPILDAWPAPNSTVRSDGTADYIYGRRQAVDQQYVLGKIDWQIDDNDSFAARYNFDKATRDRPQNIDIVFDDSTTRTQLALLEWKRIFSPRVINEARFAVNRFVLRQNVVDKKPLPEVMVFNPLAFTFDGRPWKGTVAVPGLTGLGFGSIFVQQHALNRFQYIDNLTYTTGSHALKAGANIRREQLNNIAGGFVTGGYTFVNLRGFITGATPRTFTGTVTGLTPRGMRQITMGFYVQDDWRARPNLTVNLGLRYEPYNLPTEVAGRLGTLRNPEDRFVTVGNPLFNGNPSFKNFAPRIGFAWDPFNNGKTSIRAGYGLFHELIQPLHYWSSIHNNPPEVVGVSRSNPPFPNLIRDILNSGQTFYTLEDDRLIPSLVLSPWAFSDTVEQGGVHQYQFSIDREIVPNLVVKVAYAGSRGYNLTHLLDRNTAIPQRDANGVFPFFPEGSRRRNPSFTRVRDNAWDGSSRYNSFGLTVTKRFSQGYSLQGSYTFGKSIDNNSSTSVGESRSQPNGLSTLPEDVDFDRSLSDFDVRNRLSINGSWDLPFASQHSILGGWRLTGILTAATGPRGNMGLSFNWSRSGQTTDVPDRPSLVPGGNNNPVLSDGRDPNKYFDGNQFILGPRGYFGNLGRNTLQLPGLIVADFSVQKDFKFAEARMVQFRAEMFNIANRANFGSPSTATILDESGRRSSTTGRITATTSTSRQVQFGLKLYF